MNWAEAQNECKQKYFDSNLLDLNKKKDLEEVFEYLENNEMVHHLNKMHVRIKIQQDSNEQIYEEYTSSEQTLKLKNCRIGKSKNKRKKSEHQLFDHYHLDQHINESISDFEASLADEDVITFFNSKMNQNSQQCISIFITKILNDNLNTQQLKTNFSYCIELKNCHKKLPFICKIEVNESNSLGDFYPDSLRNYQQDPKMSYVINSLLAVVYGLSRAHQNVF